MGYSGSPPSASGPHRGGSVAPGLFQEAELLVVLGFRRLGFRGLGFMGLGSVRVGFGVKGLMSVYRFEGLGCTGGCWNNQSVLQFLGSLCLISLLSCENPAIQGPKTPS